MNNSKLYWTFHVQGWLEDGLIPKLSDDFWADLELSELSYLDNRDTSIYPQVWGMEVTEKLTLE